MKRIIEGKRYDTETAEKLHSWDNGIYGNDFRTQDETLHKTAKGAYFVHGRSGPMGPYAREMGNSKCEGEVLFLVSPEEAFDWLVKHDGEEVAEKFFPDMVKDG